MAGTTSHQLHRASRQQKLANKIAQQRTAEKPKAQKRKWVLVQLQFAQSLCVHATAQYLNKPSCKLNCTNTQLLSVSYRESPQKFRPPPARAMESIFHGSNHFAYVEHRCAVPCVLPLSNVEGQQRFKVQQKCQRSLYLHCVSRVG